MSRNPFRVSWMTVALLAVAPQAVHAQWDFVGYVGDAWTSSSTMTLDNPADATSARVADVRYESRAWQRPLYWGVRVGRAVSRDRRWAVEFEYVHLKAYASPEQPVRVEGFIDGRAAGGHDAFRAVVERFQLSHGLNLFLVNGAFEQPLLPRLALVARGGIGPTLPHVEATVGTRSRDEYVWGRVGVQAAVGVNWAATRYLFLTADVKRTFTRQRLLVGATTIDAPFHTTHLALGAGVRLGTPHH